MTPDHLEGVVADCERLARLELPAEARQAVAAVVGHCRELVRQVEELRAKLEGVGDGS